jgi:hypothetical protein
MKSEGIPYSSEPSEYTFIHEVHHVSPSALACHKTLVSRFTHPLRARGAPKRSQRNGRLSANATESGKAESGNQGEQTGDGSAGREYPPQAAVKANVPLANPCDELQGSQREKQQPWNNVEERNPRVLDIANSERMVFAQGLLYLLHQRSRYLSHVCQTNRRENKEYDPGKQDCNPPEDPRDRQHSIALLGDHLTPLTDGRLTPDLTELVGQTTFLFVRSLMTRPFAAALPREVTSQYSILVTPYVSKDC